ncbi:MAG: hypothetical protein E7Z91_06940 [Cyanobacteria bacterium SIG30]|nr:hypothetical protein [Cyanobacteria bacterium SIG30]
MLKVVIIGYGEMLASLVEGIRFSNHKIVGILRYDRVRFSKSALFFKDIFNPSKDLSYIKSLKIKDINATSVNCKKFIKQIEKLNADVVLVGSWGEKIKPELFKNIKYGVINCHPALLPKHRGANPYFWAIKNGDEKSGVTFHQVNEKFDAGDILFQGAIKIEPYMNSLDLKLKACKVAEIMVKDLLNDMEKGILIPTKQIESKATFEKQISPDDLIIDLTKTINEINNHIRALAPRFKPLYRYQNKIYEIDKINFIEDNDFSKNFKNGELIKEDGKISIFKCQDGIIEILNY